MSRRHARLGIAAVIAAGALVLAPLVPAVAETVVVSSVDFEDGTTGDWTQSGGGAGTLTVVDDPDGGRMLQRQRPQTPTTSDCRVRAASSSRARPTPSA